VYAEAEEVIVAGSLYLAGAVRSLVQSGVLEAPMVPSESEDLVDDDDDATWEEEPEADEESFTRG
jgi:hypothetical protein